MFNKHGHRLNENEKAAANYEMDITQLVPSFMKWAASQGTTEIMRITKELNGIRRDIGEIYRQLNQENGNVLMLASSLSQHSVFRIIEQTYESHAHSEWRDPYVTVMFTFTNGKTLEYAIDGNEGSFWTEIDGELEEVTVNTIVEMAVILADRKIPKIVV